LKDYDKLEGSYQITRIKRLEKIAFIPQIIGIFVVFAIFLYLDGAQLKPFYLPLYLPFLIITVWILILAIEFFVFRLVEIKFRKSASAKFLMADRSMKKSMWAVAVFGVVCLLLFTPYLPEQIESTLEVNEEVEVLGEEAIYFTPRDRFDFTRVSDISVEVLDQNASVDVYIITEEYFEDGQYGMRLNRAMDDPQEATADESFYYDMPFLSFDEYRLLLISEEPVNVRYEIAIELPNTRVYPFAILSLGFLISYSVFGAMMYPIKKKHSDEAIYR